LCQQREGGVFSIQIEAFYLAASVQIILNKDATQADLPTMTSQARYCSTAWLATSQLECTNCETGSTGMIRPGGEWRSLQSNVIQHFFAQVTLTVYTFFL